MKEGIKLVAVVLLLALLAADFGLRFAVMSICDPPTPTEHDSRNSGIGRPPANAIKEGAVTVIQRYTKPDEWCRQAVEDQKSLGKWLSRLFDFRITDLVIMVFTGLLVRVGYLQTKTYNQQKDIMARQAKISEDSITINKQPRVFVADSTVRYRDSLDKLTEGITYACSLEVVGETPATVVFAELELRFGASPTNSIDLGKIGLPNTKVLISGERLLLENICKLDEPTLNKIRGCNERGVQDANIANWNFFMSGRIIFEDVFDHQYEYGFCRRVSRGGGSGHVYGSNASNYRRECKLGERFWYDGKFQVWDG